MYYMINDGKHRKQTESCAVWKYQDEDNMCNLINHQYDATNTGANTGWKINETKNKNKKKNLTDIPT